MRYYPKSKFCLLLFIILVLLVSGAIGALYVYMFVVGMAPGNTDIISTSSQQPDESKQQQQQQQLEMQDLKI